MYMYNIISLNGLSMINIKSILSQYYNYVYMLHIIQCLLITIEYINLNVFMK